MADDKGGCVRQFICILLNDIKPSGIRKDNAKKIAPRMQPHNRSKIYFTAVQPDGAYVVVFADVNRGDAFVKWLGANNVVREASIVTGNTQLGEQLMKWLPRLSRNLAAEGQSAADLTHAETIQILARSLVDGKPLYAFFR